MNLSFNSETKNSQNNRKNNFLKNDNKPKNKPKWKLEFCIFGFEWKFYSNAARRTENC
jgi:hypothetical protein